MSAMEDKMDLVGVKMGAGETEAEIIFPGRI